MTTYTIADWDLNYENAETRKRKRLFWVLVPNSQDSLGFCTIMAHERNLEIFGAWNLILQVASRCHKRGSLTSSKGRPYSAKDIAKMTRAPLDKIVGALTVLVEVGWVVADMSGESAGVAADNPDVLAEVGLSPVLKKEREKEREERKPIPTLPKEGDEGGEGSGTNVPSLLTEVLPPEFLDDEIFMRAWTEWDAHNKAVGARKWTEQRQRAQLEILAKMNLHEAKTSILTSQRRGWAEPDYKNTSMKKNAAPSTPERVVVDTKTTDQAIEALKENTK